MKSSKIKKIFAAILAMAVSMTVVAACGSKTDSTKDKEKVKQTLVYNIGADPKTVDPALNEAVDGSIIISNAFEGLCRLDKNDKAIPGVAKDWKISDDKLVYTFNLRDDAKWSDGKKVVAGDFEYAWKRALDPKTGAAYAYQLYYLKGGEEYNVKNGKAEEVGVKAIDEKTLQVTLNSATPYFLELMAFPTYMPVRKDMVESKGEAWARSAETYISNGPFKLDKWSQQEKMVFVKNDNYWNKNDVKLDTLDIRLVTDEMTAYNELKAGNFDMTESIPIDMLQDAKSAGLRQDFANLGTYFIALNVGKNFNKLDPKVQAVLGNEKVRQALSLAIDREAIVKNITKAGQIPAYSFVPKGMEVVTGKDFADKEYYNVKGDLEKAKALLKEAGFPDGQGLPTLTFLFNSEGEGHKKIAQYIQDTWSKMGVKVELQQQEWKVFQTSRNTGAYQIGRHGWSADYTDPMSFLDMWITNGGSNDAGFSNAEYDKLIDATKKETDPAKRAELFRKAEDILMKEMPVIPLYFYTKVKGVKPQVKGFRVSPLGQVYFDQVQIDK